MDPEQDYVERVRQLRDYLAEEYRLMSADEHATETELSRAEERLRTADEMLEDLTDEYAPTVSP